MRQEEFLQQVKRLLAGRIPVLAIVFLIEVKEGAGNGGVVRYELIV